MRWSRLAYGYMNFQNDDHSNHLPYPSSFTLPSWLVSLQSFNLLLSVKIQCNQWVGEYRKCPRMITTLRPKRHTRDFAYQAPPFFSCKVEKLGRAWGRGYCPIIVASSVLHLIVCLTLWMWIRPTSSTPSLVVMIRLGINVWTNQY